MLEDYFEGMSTRSLKKLFIAMFIVVAIISFSGCAVVPVGGYYQQPYYGGGYGTQMPIGPSPIQRLQQQNYYNNQYRGYYGGGYYPAVPQAGFNIQLNIQGGNGGYHHGGRHW